MKLTVAKYYIPSGRCIQALDYSNRNEDGSVGKIADSLMTSFQTKNGREVFDGGGINPDIITETGILVILLSLFSESVYSLITQQTSDLKMIVLQLISFSQIAIMNIL